MAKSPSGITMKELMETEVFKSVHLQKKYA